MSWHAGLTAYADTNPIVVGYWNYTHNTSRMIYASGVNVPEPWYLGIDEMSGEGGARYLQRVITALLSDPGKFRAMNPDNGWGNYDSLISILSEMRDAGLKFPTGEWWVGG